MIEKHRLRCLVPGCKCTVAVDYVPSEMAEAICSKHWRLTSPATRAMRANFKRRFLRLIASATRLTEGLTPGATMVSGPNPEVPLPWYRFDDDADALEALRLKGGLHWCWRELRRTAIERSVGI